MKYSNGVMRVLDSSVSVCLLFRLLLNLSICAKKLLLVLYVDARMAHSQYDGYQISKIEVQYCYLS